MTVIRGDAGAMMTVWRLSAPAEVASGASFVWAMKPLPAGVAGRPVVHALNAFPCLLAAGVELRQRRD